MKLCAVPNGVDPNNFQDDELLFEEEDVRQMKGKSLQLRFDVTRAMGLPMKFAKNVFTSYRFHYDSEENKSEISKDKGINPMINHTRVFTVENIDEDFVDYLENGVLEIQVFGEQIVHIDEEKSNAATETAEPQQLMTPRSAAHAAAQKEAKVQSAAADLRAASDGVSILVSDISRRELHLENIVKEIQSIVDPTPEIIEEIEKNPAIVVEGVKKLKQYADSHTEPTSAAASAELTELKLAMRRKEEELSALRVQYENQRRAQQEEEAKLRQQLKEQLEHQKILESAAEARTKSAAEATPRSPEKSPPNSLDAQNNSKTCNIL